VIRRHDALEADEDTGPVGPVAVFAFLFLLAASPLMRGGNRHVALIVLEAAALAFLVGLLARTQTAIRRPSLHGALLLLLLTSPAWLALVYLLPIPAPLWAAMAGRAGYLPALGSAAIPAPSWLPLSLAPDATVSSLLAGIPLAAAFCAGYSMRQSQLALVLKLFVLLVFLQVVMGLLQVAGGTGSSLYFGGPGGRPFGTFANPNHFADYVAMGLCVYIWFAWTRTNQYRHPELHEYGFSPRLRRLALWAAGGMLLVIGILISRSRGAMLSGLPMAMGALALVARSTAHTQARRAALIFTGVATLLAMSVVGFEFVLSRFDLESFGKDASFRGLLAETSFQGAAEFWPWGAGWGTYGMVYPRFQPPDIVGIADYAHQDYAQLLFEGGMFSVLLMAAFAWLAISRAALLVRAGLRRHRLRREELLSAICGLGLLGFLLHSLVEFDMHIPANAIMASLLAGIYLRPLSSEEASGD
jgi:hypothetical protein